MVQEAFDKQSRLLLENFRYPSLQVKKYDEAKGLWQARVTRSWRFYFKIEGDTYIIERHYSPPEMSWGGAFSAVAGGQPLKPTRCYIITNERL